MRLTEKEKMPRVPSFVEIQEEYWKTKHRQKALDKLGQLEDIEEELGIDLITLFKALKNGIYTKDNDLLTFPCLSIKGNILFTLPSFRTFELKDYGKTWVLDKKELTSE